MKKKIYTLYIVSFMILCITPVICMPFFRNSSSKENRRLSEFPSFISESGGINLEFPSQFEKYLSEHFAFREQLVTADSIIKADIFGTSSNEKVIVGKNNWLYFASTADDYTACNTISERCAYNTAKTLSLIQEYAEKKGSNFLFMTAPNKNTIYPEYMPSGYIKSGNKNNLALISEKLDEYNVSYIDLAELFREQDKILYHTRDSHWTNEGALLVYNAVMDRFDIEHYDYSDTPKHTDMVWNGDLDTMIFPSLNHMSEQVIYDHNFAFEYTYNFRSEDDTLITTKNDSKSVNVLMYRDSFGRSLYPFIAENSANAMFSREIPYRLDLLDEIDADLTILEIVERNLPDITEKIPLMPAPSRNIDISASIEESDKNSCFISENNNLIKIYGKLDEKYFNDNSEIYITLENNSNILCFEAFPICDSSLLAEDELCDYGYSLYINPSDIESGEYEINAYIKNNSGFICTNSLENIKINEQ